MLLLLLCTWISISLSYGQIHTALFTSSDKEIEGAFEWAKGMAMSYKGEENDHVGPWYEAALPSRFAFCMRDASHQCIGAEILGWSEQNLNIFSLFAKNISVSKDWCSYWEINKWNKPALKTTETTKNFGIIYRLILIFFMQHGDCINGQVISLILKSPTLSIFKKKQLMITLINGYYRQTHCSLGQVM